MKENITLKELQDKEALHLARRKENAVTHIAKIEARILLTKSPTEKERLNNLLLKHKEYQESLETVDVNERASLKFEKVKGRTELKERLRPNNLVNPLIK